MHLVKVTFTSANQRLLSFIAQHLWLIPGFDASAFADREILKVVKAERRLPIFVR